MKPCKKCRAEKSDSEYYRTTKGYLWGTCKACVRAKMRERSSHKDRKNEDWRDFYEWQSWGVVYW